MRFARPLFALVLLTLVSGLLAGCGVADLVEDTLSEEKDTPPGQQMTHGERQEALAVAAMANELRAANGLDPLIWDETAADAAYDHAVDMRIRGFYAHQNPDGLSPAERLQRAQVDMAYFGGENIARHNDGPREVMDAWIASPSHLRVLLGPGLTHIGVGVHKGKGGPWWVQEFFVRYEED
ncbi:MAG: CAP domain-containing protein [Planctomycetota bacterium]|nr:CAP domain-containing protein [Planctomycetota bacterium]